MATLKSSAPLKPLRQPRRSRWRFVAIWAAIIGAALAAWFWKPITGSATAAASYGARIGCSCRYVAGRDIDQCRGDLESGQGWVTLSDDDEARSVTARVPLIASQTATLRAGEGCVLEKWSD